MMNFIENTIKQESYDFLRDTPELGDNIMFLALGGSYGYGTNVEGSDVDIRGVTANPVSTLLGLGNFENFMDAKTDTTIFSFQKFVSLATNCNPNIIEMLGYQEYAMVSPLGQELLNHKSMFLSQRASATFGGYVQSQLRRLKNALIREEDDTLKKEEFLKSRLEEWVDHQAENGNCVSNLEFSIITQENNPFEPQVGCSVTFQDYPVKKVKGILSEISTISENFEKVNHRNKKKDDLHLNKHAMHLIRLFLTGIDLLETGEIVTYREKDLALLMSIRNGAYLTDNSKFNEDFFALFKKYEERFQYAKKHSVLPKTVDMKKIEEFVMDINLKILNLRKGIDQMIDNRSKRILEILQEEGFQSFLVGGCVRDSLLGQEPKDWDICTNCLEYQHFSVQFFLEFKVLNSHGVR